MILAAISIGSFSSVFSSGYLPNQGTLADSGDDKTYTNAPVHLAPAHMHRAWDSGDDKVHTNASASRAGTPNLAAPSLAMDTIEISLIIVPLEDGQTKRLHLSFSADHLLLAIFVIALLGLFILYRRETDNQNKLRLAAAGGLISVIFLCTALPLPWTEAPASTSEFNLCSLGQEAYCIGTSAIAKGFSLNETTALIERVKPATAAIGAAQITLILLFLPAYLWLLVVPLSRGAHALVYGAAVPGFFLCLSTLIYRGFLWSEITRQRGAADVSLIAGITAVVVAIAVATRARKALAEANQSVEIPQATMKA